MSRVFIFVFLRSLRKTLNASILFTVTLSWILSERPPYNMVRLSVGQSYPVDTPEEGEITCMRKVNALSCQRRVRRRVPHAVPEEAQVSLTAHFILSRAF